VCKFQQARNAYYTRSEFPRKGNDMAVSKPEMFAAQHMVKKLVHDGDTIHFIKRHETQAGTTVHLDAYVIIDNEPRYLTSYLARALGYAIDKYRDTLVVRGSGMDAADEVMVSLRYLTDFSNLRKNYL